MGSQNISILIVDDNKETCNILHTFFEMQPDIQVCGEVYDGIQAIQAIKVLKPDIAIVDIVMPGKDGIAVLEDLQENPPDKRPLVIITSASGQELITRKAASLGADYFIMKPYSLDILLSRIRMVAGFDKKLNSQEYVKRLDMIIARLVLSLGVPTQILGYQYMLSALQTLILQNKPCSIGKTVYCTIASDFGTTTDCVERAIRQAIHRMHKTKTELYCTIMEQGKQALDKPPSNSRFLTLAAAYIKLEENL